MRRQSKFDGSRRRGAQDVPSQVGRLSTRFAVVGVMVSVSVFIFGFGNGLMPAAPRSSRNGPSVTLIIGPTATQHTISPLLLGDGMEWLNCGNGIWDCQNNAGPRQGIISPLQELHLGILRYPGGGLADFFHWQGAVGPVSSRQPQINPFQATDPRSPVTAMPFYGPDEFATAAGVLNTQMLITANAGSGTAEEAAAWLAHYKSVGVSARYWEIGNEVYMGGKEYSSAAVSKTPEQYAAIYDSFASALRAVNPNIEVGAIGCHDTGAFNLCYYPDWNRRVLSKVRQKIDFLAIHNSYAPAITPSQVVDDDTMFRSLLAAPEYIRKNMELQAHDVKTYAPAASQNLFLAITEHAALFLPAGPLPDDPQIIRDQSLGSALFSALTLNVFFSNPSVGMGAHINPNSPAWQAAVQTGPDGFSHPIRTAYFYMLFLYSAAINGQYVPVSVQGAPTYSSAKLGIIPAISIVPVLDAVAVLLPGEGTSLLYVVNRDLHNPVAANILFTGFGLTGPRSLTADTLNGANYLARNTAASPSAVSVSTASLPARPQIQYTFAPHSLTRITAK